VLARTLLDGDDDASAIALVGRARQLLARAVAVDPSLENLSASLGNAEVELRDASVGLDTFLDGAEVDPARLGQVDAQLARIHDLARKHRVPAAELLVRRDQIAGELAESENAGSELAQIDRLQEVASSAWRLAAEQLGASRRSVAARLSAEVTGLMGELGMAGGRLSIELEDTRSAEPDRLGHERLEFMVSANPGQPMRPLRKVASGGELSRIALAIEVAALGDDPVPTMIFDEVDTGVGGAVAEILGQKLRRLGHHAQVLCVTHLPQVAAQGHHHLRVWKEALDGTSRTGVDALSDEDRVTELSRMLGGIEITPTTRAHARQMLDSSRR
jgi:DNA repair protein RecN (Recombination protein N)